MGRSSASSVHPLAERVKSVERLAARSDGKRAQRVRRRHEWMQASIDGLRHEWMQTSIYGLRVWGFG